MEIVLVMGGFIAFVSFYIHAVANRKSDNDKPLSVNKNTPIKTFDYGINLRSNKETANNFETTFTTGNINPYYKKTYRDANDDFKLRTDLRIKYIDRNGKSSQRDITVQSVSMFMGDGVIESYCHVKRAERTFRMERISECIDLETGEFIDDIYKLLKDKYEISPEKSFDRLINEEKDAMRVLEYIGRADGQLRKPERVLIYEALRKIANDDRLSDEMLGNAMKYTDSMSERSFKKAIGKMADRSSEFKKIISSTAQAIVDTQKTVHPAEQEALDYIGRKFFNI